MTIRFVALVLALPTLLAAAPPPRAPGLPSRIGQCAPSRISDVGQRLEDGATHESLPNSGSQVELANGVLGVSYDQVPAVNRSRRGDPVRVCLVSVPRHCPAGDARGRFYRTTNLRTHQSWTLPDAEHGCGGA